MYDYDCEYEYVLTEYFRRVYGNYIYPRDPNSGTVISTGTIVVPSEGGVCPKASELSISN